MNTFFKFFQNTEEHVQTHSAGIILIPRIDKDATRKENCRPLSFMNIHEKILNKILVNWIQEHFIHYDQVGFITGMQGLFDTCKLVNIIYHHINKMKDKNHMVLSIDSEKAFDRIQHLLMIKTLSGLSIERIYLKRI